MKRFILISLCTLLIVTTAACTNNSTSTTGSEETKLTGVAKGFGGELTVEVIKEGDEITSVEVIKQSETADIATPALEEIPKAIVESNSTDVEAVSGATVTSNAIIDAVNNALDPEAYPAPSEEAEDNTNSPESIEAAEAYQGFGISNMGRIGPGKDDTDTSVYSINQVFANALFDEDGKILALHVDQLESATPNYDGDGMPHFSGFPGQGGYNLDENHDAKIDSKTPDTEDQFLNEIEGWATKRDRGENYVMGTGTWANQMDAFEDLFVGMTVEEVEEWFNSYTSDVNGRPLKADSSNDEDVEKFNSLEDDEKEMLADVTSSATMSLNDSHGNIIEAIRLAYDNKVALESESIALQGFGVSNTGRIGPGKDDTDTSVYSINQVFAHTLFDEDGKIIDIYVDQLEIATPNYDGDGMPHFSGFPGQGGYNLDENHDAKIDSKTPDTEDQFLNEIEGWATKRDRGENYVMGTGTWANQMDAFEDLFVGMTVEEVEEWFNNYTSDINGRPLKADSNNDEDVEKFNSLEDDKKEMLADVTSSATMSLNDSHGNIIEAIKKSFENAEEIDITIK